MMNPKIIFFGTPELVIPILDELAISNLSPSVIVTGEDKPQGRKLIVTPPPPKVWALDKRIPVWQPKTLDEAFIAQVAAESFDIGIVVAYGKILPERLLSTPACGMLNVHYSLLPAYRGATPVEGAILGGEKETGVSVQKMVYELDAGPIVAESRILIGDTETTPELRARLNEVGKNLLVETIRSVCAGTATYTEQNPKRVTYTKKIKKEDGLIDLGGNPEENYQKFRAYAGWPRSFFFKDGKRIIITQAHLSDGVFTITHVIPEGGKEMTWEAFIRP